jgi:hypothetical protein
MRLSLTTILFAVAGLAAAAHAQNIFHEVEPNETKATASGPFSLAHGDAISGTTLGTTTTPGAADSLDCFLVRTAPLPMGVYKHRLVLTTPGFAAHTISMRGLTQSAGIINMGTDVPSYQGQTSSNPPRYIQWYGFGKEEGIYLRVTGTANTTSPYFCTLETTPQPVPHLGIFKAGEITIATTAMGYTGDTALWVYDDQFNPVVINGEGFGNDQEPAPGTSSLSRLTRTFPPGTYHLGITIAEMVLLQGAPADDRRRNMTAADFPDVVWSEATTGTANMSFRIIDADGEVPIRNVFKTDRHEVYFFRFAVGEPARGACCLEDGTCISTTENLCRVQLGLYAGDGTDCTTPCIGRGACCTLGECSITSVRACTLASGVFGGGGSACQPCPPSTATLAPLPAQSSTFHGTGTNLLSRGFWFTAPTNFTIRGLRVPDTQFHGTQHVEVVRFLEPPPDGNLAGTNNFISLFRRDFIPSSAIIECEIVVAEGDMIGIIGICGDDAETFVSYGAGPYNSQILGQQATFRRLLMQHNLATSQARSLSTSSAEIGRIEMYYTAPAQPCYANCDGSTVPPILNVEDFSCFINRFAEGTTLPHQQQLSHYANCDGSTTAPVLNVEDFSCFINRFAQGCP